MQTAKWNSYENNTSINQTTIPNYKKKEIMSININQ